MPRSPGRAKAVENNRIARCQQPRVEENDQGKCVGVLILIDLRDFVSYLTFKMRYILWSLLV
jgi:hypothetical protein